MLKSNKNLIPFTFFKCACQAGLGAQEPRAHDLVGAGAGAEVRAVERLTGPGTRNNSGPLSNLIRTEHVTPFFKQLEIFKLRDLCKLEIGKFMFQLNSNKISKILENSFQILDEQHNYNTRLRQNCKYFSPRVNKKFAQTQLSFRGTQHWANMPTELKELPHNNFKKRYKLLLTKSTKFLKIKIQTTQRN